MRGDRVLSNILVSVVVSDKKWSQMYGPDFEALENASIRHVGEKLKELKMPDGVHLEVRRSA